MSDTESNQERSDHHTHVKAMIKEYIKLDDHISEANKNLKEYRTKRTDLGKAIQEHMIKHSVKQIDLKHNGTLNLSKRKPAKKITKKEIMSVLIDMLDESKASEVLDELYNEEHIEEVTKLERKK